MHLVPWRGLTRAARLCLNTRRAEDYDDERLERKELQEDEEEEDGSGDRE
jgi:hypothetical protein